MFNSQRRAFTMVEVVIVLAISALVIVTTTIPYQKRNAELSEEQFWRDVKQRWQEAQTRARVEGKATFIYLTSRSKREIRFEYHTDSGKKVTEEVLLPKQLHVASNEDMVKIYKNGYVSPRTWSFVSKATMTNYDMKIQMGWGGYYVQKTAV
ncbi:prepilin-type N-terminal cleavage/methylation domain-containing protein [Limosilactobacillus fermentum]|nr:prepilin-type N-terminal cleavage/methylation domain-containing protein [Limosilactobacillus fermentum]MDF4006733.1 prepilin-type N-terminal cleavage/methylation domain-containing protein [Limosilactobacillus fermentum]MDF4015662.1 prepilin-type N-terminal cleavage/methylation domain-containing protein [Limosilactobacillus fermentum]WJD85397.1 prepilin-type N-terminal cleavage/methylation domain-containing protein [Limosilactobacillus fermentum]